MEKQFAELLNRAAVSVKPATKSTCFQTSQMASEGKSLDKPHRSFCSVRVKNDEFQRTKSATDS